MEISAASGESQRDAQLKALVGWYFSYRAEGLTPSEAILIMREIGADYNISKALVNEAERNLSSRVLPKSQPERSQSAGSSTWLNDFFRH